MMIWSVGTGKEIAVNVPNHGVLIADLEARLNTRQGFAVATLNLDHSYKLRTNQAFRDAYSAHSHVTADGRPVVWMARLSGQAVDLVAGSELIEPLVALAARLGVPVGLFGASQAALDAAAGQLQHQNPELKLSYVVSPPMGFDPTGPAADEAIDQIRQSGAQLVFLALGAPKQEIFAQRAFERLPDVGFVSIGAGLDFIAGTQTRAPTLARSLSLEWLWRLAHNPRRLAGRYAACIAILPLHFVQALRIRWSARRSQ